MAAIELRNVIETDLPTLFEHQRDAEALALAAFPSRDHEAFYAHWKKILADPSVDTKTIVVDNEVAGYIGSWRDGERLVGYWLGKEFWGKGIATKALALFLDAMNERPLHAHVVKHNTGSIRVLEKCGFRFDREHDGELVMVLHSAAT